MCNFCDSQSCTGQCKGGFPFNRPFSKYCAPVIPAPTPCIPCSSGEAEGCLVNITTDCVSTVKTYQCFQTATGTSLTTVLDKIDALLCATVTPTCKIKVSEADECCDYLSSKFTSDSINITTQTLDSGCQQLKLEVIPPTPEPYCIKVTENDIACCGYLSDKVVSSAYNVTVTEIIPGCEVLRIEPKNWVYYDLQFISPWTSPIVLAMPRYATQDGESVKFSGSISYPAGLNTLYGTVVTNIANISLRPTQTVYIPFVIDDTVFSGEFVGGSILITTNGDIRIDLNKKVSTAMGNFTISFDSIFYTL